MKTIDQFNFSGRKAIIRVDYNVPLDEKYQITEDSRIVATLPTINKILSDGGAAILMSHLGRPKGGYEEKYSLKHVVPHLSKLLNKEVKFADDCIGESAKRAVAELKMGEVLLLENLRFHKEEEKGEENFAKELSMLGDIYVNDAFGTAHRAHASTTIIAKFFPRKKCFGYVMAKELEAISKIMEKYNHPYTAIIGGAKVSTKIATLNQLMNKVDNILIGGGMAYTFIKAKGGKIGTSLVEDDKLDVAKEILAKAEDKNVKIYLPTDTVIADNFSNDANTEMSDINNIKDGWLGIDIGPETIKKYEEVILNSRTILWNGPMGVFEFDKFEKGTKAVIESIARATAEGAFSLVGGGDSVAALGKFNMENAVSYVSTGGGALIECLEGIVLPGVKAILED